MIATHNKSTRGSLPLSDDRIFVGTMRFVPQLPLVSNDEHKRKLLVICCGSKLNKSLVMLSTLLESMFEQQLLLLKPELNIHEPGHTERQ